VDILLSAIPVALRSGLGRPQVHAIQKLESAARDIWTSYQAGDEDLFKAVFTEALARCDDSRQPEDSEEPAGGERSSTSETGGRSLHPESAGSAGDEPPMGSSQQEEGDPTALAARSPAGPVSTPAEKKEGTQPTTGRIDPAEAQAPAADPTADMPTEIRALRRRSYQLAKQLAERNGMFNIVLYVPVGFGYLIADVPPLSREKPEPMEQFWYKTMLWWHLAACTEMEATPVEIVRKCLIEDSPMRQVIETQSLHPLEGKIVTPPPSYISSSLWSQVNEEDWRTVLDMMHTYRAIRKLVEEKNLNLWRAEG